LVPSARTVPWQRADLPGLGVRAEDAATAVQWVTADGRVFAGAEAIARMFLTGNIVLRLVGVVMLLPVIRAVAKLVYRVVANNRSHLPGGTPACKVDR
jgi:predicted DCC family thiol-disulfide oxidoreductase YuxK